jgi:hypothetical protein
MNETIEQLAADLDAVEIEFDRADAARLRMADGMSEISLRYFRLSEAYFGAIRGPVLAARHALENNPDVPCDRHAVLRARDEMRAAQERRRIIFEAGYDFSSKRERLDAAAAEELAESNYEIISERYQRAKRIERNAKTRKRKITSDGLVRTGYKMIDGVRVPVMERVR